METAKPLDNPGFRAVAGIKGVHETGNANGSDLTPEVSGIYSDTFMNDTVGVLVSGSFQKRENREEEAHVASEKPRERLLKEFGNPLERWQRKHSQPLLALLLAQG